MKMIVFVAALAVAGCGSKKASTSQCQDSVGKAIDQMMAQGKSANPAMAAQADAIASKMKEVMAKDCVEQNWSPDVRKCLSSATSRMDIKHCRTMLPPAQAGKVQADLIQARTSAMGGMPGMAPHGMMPHGGMAPPGAGAPPSTPGAGAPAGGTAPAPGSAAPAPGSAAP